MHLTPNCFQIELCSLNTHKELNIDCLQIESWRIGEIWSSKFNYRRNYLKMLSCSLDQLMKKDKSNQTSKTFLFSNQKTIRENLNFVVLQLVMMSNTLKFWLFQEKRLLTLGALQPLVVFLLPQGLEMLGSDNFPATLIKFPSVFIGPGVSSTLVFGVHANLGLNFKQKNYYCLFTYTLGK